MDPTSHPNSLQNTLLLNHFLRMTEPIEPYLGHKWTGLQTVECIENKS